MSSPTNNTTAQIRACRCSNLESIVGVLREAGAELQHIVQLARLEIGATVVLPG
jgi:hypothetical protein